MTDQPITEPKPRWGIRRWQWVLVGVVLLVIVLIGASIPALSMAREKARRISCASNLKGMGLAMRMYSSDNNEQLPYLDGAQGFELVRPQYLANHKMYLCASTTTTGKDDVKLTEETIDYLYFGGYSEADDAGLVWACDKLGNHVKYGNAVYLDGHVSGYGGDWDMMVSRFRAEHEKVVGPHRQPALSLSKGAATEKKERGHLARE